MQKILIKFPLYKEMLLLIVTNAVFVAAVFLLKNSLPPVVPLYYGLPSGARQLAPWYALAFPPIGAIVIIVINIILISLLKTKEFLQKTLLVTSLVITFMANYTVVKIILLVGNL